MTQNILRALLAMCLLVAGCACGRKSPEARVRAAFEGSRTAVEDGDAARAVAPLDAAFQGPEGMDKAATRLFLMGLLSRQKVGITVLRNEVRVEGPEATQAVDLLLTARGGGLLPEDASRRSFLLHWREVDGTWRLREAEASEPVQVPR